MESIKYEIRKPGTYQKENIILKFPKETWGVSVGLHMNKSWINNADKVVDVELEIGTQLYHRTGRQIDLMTDTHVHSSAD